MSDSALTSSAAGAHEVQFYADDGFLADGVSTFIAKGLLRGHAAIVIATSAHWLAIETRLQLHDIDVAHLRTVGRLTIADASEMLERFMVDGLPQSAKFQSTVGDLVRSKLAAYPALCAYGEMVDLLSASENYSGTLALEELWNKLLAGQPAHLLCGYRLDRFDRESHRECFRHICHAHSHVLPTEEFTQITEDEAQRRAVAELQQQALALRSEVETRKSAEAALRKKAAALERSNKDLERFTFIAAHDLQEPLRMVTQYMDLVRMRGGDVVPHEIKGYIDHAVVGATRMSALIDALIAFVSTSESLPVLARVDVNEVIAQVRRSLARELHDAGAHLSHADLPVIASDREKTILVFTTLIANALQYRSAAPLLVAIAAVRERDRWIFSVRDNGIGIDPAHHETIFGVFQRLHNQQDIPGTGMGLPLCRRVLEQLGGQIWVESARAFGANFYFSIPSDESSA